MRLKRFSRTFNRILEHPKVLKGKFKGIHANHSYTCLKVRDLVGDVRTVIDIGANEGLFIHAAKYVFPNAKIYAFEPLKPLSDKLAKIKRVTSFNIGLWNKDKDNAEFFANFGLTGASSFLEPTEDYKKYISKKPVTKIKITQKRFDSLNLEIQRPCYVKIDVEGAEEKVLRGFGDKLKEIDALQIEWFFKDFHKDQMRLSKLFPFLEKYGFIGFIQVELGYLDDYPSACDLIFFKKRN